MITKKTTHTILFLFLSVFSYAHNLSITEYHLDEMGLTASESSTLEDENESVTQINRIPSVAQTFTVNGVTFKMIPVEGGTFTMGATPEQEDPSNDEKPAHLVTLSSYMIGETEVTQALWEVVMGSNPSYHGNTYPQEDAKRPVDNVSWDDCQVFVAKLSSLTGKRFRLPTEAEWEFAARGGNKSQHTQYSGSSNIDEVAWYYANSNDIWCYKVSKFVKKKKPNELGIYDMSGNVWEWCQDRKGNYSRNAQTNPTGPSSGSERVARGGSFNSSANICCTSVRAGVKPDMHPINFGLRVCLSR